MKKTIIAIFFCVGSLTAFGQNEPSAFETDYSSATGGGTELSFTSKNGHEVLPKAGDWALGIDALPILRYLGNSLNGNENNQFISFQKPGRMLPTATIYGKMMVRDDFAYRASIDLFVTSTNNKFRVDDDNSSNPDDYLFDRIKETQYGVTLNGGFEHRRGKGRVQGIYGAEAYVFYSTGSTRTFEFANQITQSNQTPSMSPFFVNSNPISNDVPTPELATRITKINRQDSFEAGIRGFIGVEYFFAPQMSIGGEFFLGAGYGITGGQSVTGEGYDGNTNEVREYVNVSESTTSLTIGTNNAGGAINLLFYF